MVDAGVAHESTTNPVADRSREVPRLSHRQRKPFRTGDQVIAHKLFAPAGPPGAVRRDAILQRILARNSPRVVLLQAPAGHGKTTLLQQAWSACDAQGMRCGWLTFDEADNDITRFAAHMQALVDYVATREAPDDMPVQVRGRTQHADWLTTQLVAVGRPVALFLDEFQTLSNRPVLSFFRNLFESVPAEVRIFVGTRTLPRVGLSRLEVNNRALVIRPADLCFSRDEVARFFQDVSDLGMQPEETAAIHERTEGWPAAVQLYRLSLAQPSVRESLRDIADFRPRPLADYLADNVLQLQTPAVQQFLLQSSLLTRLSAPLCNAVLERDDAQRMLQTLESAGLFLRSLDAEGYWFKYHTLFSSFLADQLREQDPEAARRIHERAASWFHDQGLHEEAIHHALASDDADFAARILDSWTTKLIAEGNLMTVERWSERIPAKQLRANPDLVVKIVWALTFLRRHRKLAPLLAMIEDIPATERDAMQTHPAVVLSMAAVVRDDIQGAADIVATMDVRDSEVEGFHAFELGAAANLEGYLAMTRGEFESAREILSLARAHSDRGDATFSWGYSVGTAAMNLLLQGQTQDAIGMFRQCLAEPRVQVDDSFASAAIVACYVHALYEVDDIDTALDQFRRYHDVIADAALLDYLALAYFSAARIHDSRDEGKHAAAVLEEAETIGHASRWPRLVRLVAWERVRRALAADEVDHARRIAAAIQAEPAPLPAGWLPFAEDTAGDAIGRIRLDLRDANPEPAMRLISTEQSAATAQGRTRRQVKLHILEAIGHRRLHNANAAHRSLRRALNLAAPAGLVRTFLEEGPAVIDLLRSDLAILTSSAGVDATEGPIQQFVVRILGTAGVIDADTAIAPPGDHHRPLEALTDRETEILQLLANGASNKDIARHVFVSENTVKFHLKNIYSKLGVNSRVQAISAARHMQLL